MVWQMSFFGLFKKTERLATLADLQAFCVRHALCSARKDMSNFVEQRIEIMPQQYFEPQERLDALNRACWRAYPVALINILEMLSVEFRNTPQAGLNLEESETLLVHIALSLMQDALPDQPFADHVWLGYGQDVCLQLAQAHSLPPRYIRDIPRSRVRSFCALMPLHPDVVLAEHSAIERHLQVKICRAHDGFLHSVDWPSLSADIKQNLPSLAHVSPKPIKSVIASV